MTKREVAFRGKAVDGITINDVRTTDRGTIYIYGKNGPLAAFHKDLLALAGGAR